MSVYAKRRQDLDGDRLDEVGEHIVYTRAFELASNKTLEDVSLRRGNFLPAANASNADEKHAVIVEVRTAQEKRKDKSPGLCKVAWVTAIKARPFWGTDTGDWEELERTRGIQRAEGLTWHGMRRWKGPNANAHIFGDKLWDAPFPVRIAGRG
jgi:hypothetical protein